MSLQEDMEKQEGMKMFCEVRSALDLLPLLKSEGRIATKPFLNLCNSILNVLDKIGPTMAVLRQDVHQNIQRLEKFYEMDPTKYSSLSELLRKEVEEGSVRKATSCTRALVWLTRSMDFTVALLGKLIEDPNMNLMDAVEESYSSTLKPFHGWISSAAYKVALQLVPERKNFISMLMTEGEDYTTLKEEIQSLVSSLSPLLNEIHAILKTFRQDRLKST